MTPAKYKSERIKRGLSQAALASIMGVTRATINAREADRTEITPEAWLALCSLPLTQAKPRRKSANDQSQKRTCLERMR